MEKVKENRVKILILTVLLASCALFLSACQFPLEKHQEAVAKAIEAARGSEQQYLIFKADDVADQIEAQAKDMENPKDDETVTYKLTVQVPDLAEVEISDASLNVPEVDVHNFDEDVYTEAYLTEATAKLDTMLSKDDKALAWKDARLTVNVSRQEDKTYLAKVSQSDLGNIALSVTASLESKAQEFLDADEGLVFGRAASEIYAAFDETLGTHSFGGNSEIVDIEQKEDGSYAVTVKYPDPEKVYTRSVEKLLESYRTNGTEIYYEVDENKISGNVNGHVSTVLKDNTDVKTETLTAPSASEYSDQFSAIHTSINEVRSTKVAAGVQAINDEFVVREQEKPATGVMSGANSGQPIAVTTSAELGDLHLTFYQISGTDLAEEGSVVLTVYIHAGDSLTIHLPAGNYKMIQGTGDTWYGPEKSFGTPGRYQLANQVMSISAGYTYELTLYGVEGGNLPTKGIDFPY